MRCSSHRRLASAADPPCAPCAHSQPFWKPDLAAANKIWDEWDRGEHGMEKAYGFPRMSPRKKMKMTEDCETACIFNAVATVFVYKQTSCLYECNQLDEDGQPKPFELKMLYPVLQLLQPDEEIMLYTWIKARELCFGQSSACMAATTVAAETFGIKLDSFIRKSELQRPRFEGLVQQESELYEFDKDHNSKHVAQTAAPVALVPAVGTTEGGAGDELAGRLQAYDSCIKKEDAARMEAQLVNRRRWRMQYRLHCSKSSLKELTFRDCTEVAQTALGGRVMPPPRQKVYRDNPVPADGASQSDWGRYVFRKIAEHLLHGVEAPAFYKKDGSRADNPEKPKDWTAVDADFLEGWHSARADVFDHPHFCPDERFVAWKGAMEKLRGLEGVPEGAQREAMREALEIEELTARTEMRNSPYCKKVAEAVFAVAEEVANGDLSCAERYAEYSKAAEPFVKKKATDKILPLEASCVLPAMQEVNVFYSMQTLVQWACDRAAKCEANSPDAYNAGTHATLHFAEYPAPEGTAKRMNHAWLRPPSKCMSYMELAKHVSRGAKASTVKQMDMHVDGLKDQFWMMAQPDAMRLAPSDMPRLEKGSRPEDCFRNMYSDSVHVVGSGCLAMTPFGPDAKRKGDHPDWSRHPGAAVDDSELQRRVDSMVRGGRLSALAPFYSNRVERVPTLRLMGEAGVEANTVILTDHVALLTECALRCRDVPGVSNRQEQFCHGEKGPSGWSSMTGEGADLRKKILNSGDFYTLSYSRDVIHIGLALAMNKMFYDPLFSEHAKQANERYASLGLKIGDADRPEHTLPFPGYDEANRQSLTIRVGTSRDPEFKYVEAGDPDVATSEVTVEHVSRSIGRPATTEDVRRHIARRQGSRAMRGIQGDLFCRTTLVEHTLRSLADRGLIKGTQDEPAVMLVQDRGSNILPRVIERACQKGVPRYAKLGLQNSSPQTYRELEKMELEKLRNPPATAGASAAATIVRKQVGAPAAKPWVTAMVPGTEVPDPEMDGRQIFCLREEHCS